MRYRLGKAQESCVAGGVSLAAAFGAALLVSGCAADIEAGVPATNPGPSLSGGGPKNTGTYPNLNVRPQAAAAQLTAEERDAKLATLEAAAARAKAGAAGTTISPAELARLRKLAADQGAETLAEIEAQ